MTFSVQQVRADFPELDRFAEVPTLSAIAYAVGNTTDRFNVETLAYARSSMNDAARELAEKLKLKNTFTLICLFTAQIRSFSKLCPRVLIKLTPLQSCSPASDFLPMP